MAYTVNLQSGAQLIRAGADYRRGLWPRGLRLTCDDHGPKEGSFVIDRDPQVPWPDLDAGQKVWVDVDGIPVWGGRLRSAAPADGGAIAVNLEGLQANLDDDQTDVGWVNLGAKGWRDNRALDTPSAMISGGVAIANQDTGKMRVGFPKNLGLAGTNGVGVTFDAGPGRVVEAFAFAYELTGQHANLRLYTRHHDFPSIFDGTALDTGWAATTMTVPAATGTLTGDTGSGNGKRYLTILLYNPSGSGAWTTTADHNIIVNNFYVFTKGSYRTGTASNLKASDVIASLPTSGAAPQLSTDTAGITATALVIPDLWPGGYRTPREIVDGVNAYHDYQWAVDMDGRFRFRPRPTTPDLYVGNIPGGFQDQAIADLSQIYNKAVIEYTDETGTSQVTTRTSVSALLNRSGLTRTMRVNTSARLLTAAAEAIGDAWLTRRAAVQFSGSFTAGWGTVRDKAGVNVPPYVLLLHYGQLVSVNRPNPQQGMGDRTGEIVSVEYDADAGTAGVSLDTTTNGIEAILGRLALIQGGKALT
jgi:hypothetical protein